MTFSRFAGAIAALVIPTSLFAATALPNFDAVASAPATERPAVRAAAAAIASPGSAVRTEWHSQFGVPSFVWFGGGASNSARVATTFSTRATEPVETTARRYVWDNASTYGIGFSDVSSAYVASTHDTGRGAIVVKFRQRINGVDVFRDELNVVMNRNRELIAMSGSLPGADAGTAAAAGMKASSLSAPFSIDARQAIVAALGDMAPEAAAKSADFQPVESVAGYTTFAAAPRAANGNAIVKPARTKPVWFRLPDHLEAAFYVEAEVASSDSTGSAMYAYVISATDGRILFRKNLTEDQSAPTVTYRVWADPNNIHRPMNGPQGFGGFPNPNGYNDGYQAPLTKPILMTLASGPISTSDPWLAAGATESFGNNADAYVDVSSPDGLSAGDFRATMSAANTFDYTYDLDAAPNASKQQQMAAITQLFYTVNFLHDWFYDSGFDEKSGNAQVKNYNRGGVDNDPLRAEAQDYGGKNNANMSTPADGSRPRMQMYLWDAKPDRVLAIDQPVLAAGNLPVGYALFGPQSFNVSGNVVRAVPSDGCSALTNGAAISGKIAIVDRGGCNFADKALNAQNAGAIAVIVGNQLSTDALSNMACAGSECTAAETTLPPSMLLKSTDASRIKNLLDINTPVHVMMRKDAAPDRDGSIDNAIIAHEWGHYLSNRLIGDGAGLGSRQSRGMGEGWSDFVALLMMTRPEDTAVATNSKFDGAYAAASYAFAGGKNGPELNTAYYFGLRRVPYSSNMSFDPLTLKHVANGNGITGAVVSFGGDGLNNSEVHSAGEVWATMLWECYTSILRDTLGSNPRLTFAQAQKRMKDYLVASLKVTPPDPTFLDARDALLAVAAANDPADYQAFFKAFAKRGAGLRAVAADRYSLTNYGPVEDFTVGADVVVTDIEADDSVTSCNKDGILDAGETGIATISIRNSGISRLESTTAKISSVDPRVSFENGGSITFPASDPQQIVTAKVKVSIAPTSEVLLPMLTLSVNDPALTFKDGVNVAIQPRLNGHDQAKWSKSDDVETTDTTWRVTATPVGSRTSFPLWSRVQTGVHDHEWWGDERYNSNDSSIESPTLLVSDTDPLVITFKHRYGFDYATDTSGGLIAIDGGVVEISTDGGATWTDIGANASPGYGATAIYKTNGNPLEGRKAFVAFSPGASLARPTNGSYLTTTIDLGTTYAGKSVIVRFRIGCGIAHANELLLGWEIDDITFSGIKNTPFNAVVPSSGICGVAPSTTSLRLPATFDPSQPVHIEAVVTSSLATPTGTVEFFDNGVLLGSARLANGSASLDTKMAAGSHLISAAYAGTMNFVASTASANFGAPPPPAPPRRRAVGH